MRALHIPFGVQKKISLPPEATRLEGAHRVLMAMYLSGLSCRFVSCFFLLKVKVFSFRHARDGNYIKILGFI